MTIEGAIEHGKRVISLGFDGDTAEFYKLAVKALKELPQMQEEIKTWKWLCMKRLWELAEMPVAPGCAIDASILKGTLKESEINDDDAISRKEAMDCATVDVGGAIIKDRIKYLKSVKPKRATGHWVDSHIPESTLMECSSCGFACGAYTFNYCPECGAYMKSEEQK